MTYFSTGVIKLYQQLEDFQVRINELEKENAELKDAVHDAREMANSWERSWKIKEKENAKLKQKLKETTDMSQFYSAEAEKIIQSLISIDMFFNFSIEERKDALEIVVQAIRQHEVKGWNTAIKVCVELSKSWLPKYLGLNHKFAGQIKKLKKQEK